MAHLRAATIEDAPELARLLTLLGHPTAESDLRTHWAAWQAEGNQALVLAREDGSLAGLSVLHVTHTLHRRRPVGRITALIIDAQERGRGLGRALVAASEDALRAAGCGLMEITSHRGLVGAHAFYQHLGYALTSLRFARELN